MSVFIEGEKIDLCVPECEDIPEWVRWVNDPSVTRHLDLGMFPQTETMQKDFVFGALRAKDRVLLTIKSKEKKLLGTISLSDINFDKRECQIALLVPNKDETAPFAAVEAMALMVTHAFERLGVTRVFAGQAYPELKSWNEVIEVIGFFPEGIVSNGFKHGNHVSNAIKIAIYKDEYDKIKKQRAGTIWPGSDQIGAMVEGVRRDPSHAKVLLAISTIRLNALQHLLGSTLDSSAQNDM